MPSADALNILQTAPGLLCLDQAPHSTISKPLVNQAIMFLGLRKSPRSSRPSEQVVLDNPILYHMMSLDPNCPKFFKLLAEFLKSGKELKNLKKAEDERVLRLADFLYEVSVASHPYHLSYVSRSWKGRSRVLCRII